MYSTPLNDLGWKPPYAVTEWGKTPHPEQTQKRRYVSFMEKYGFHNGGGQESVKVCLKVLGDGLSTLKCGLDHTYNVHTSNS